VADTKTSDLTPIAGVDIVTGDQFIVLDVSDTTQGPAGTLKIVTRDELVVALQAAGLGTVSSVGLSVPTGLSVAGSPVTGSGTLTVTFAAGYSIPTDVKQGQWDTAYGWGDHASAGYQVQLAEGAFTDGDKTKLNHITVTQAVDLDAIETRVNELDAAVVLKGEWDASAGTFPGGGTAQPGDSWIVSTGGTVGGVAFTADDRIIAITDNASTTVYAANWHKADYTDLVTSVNGKTGAVTGLLESSDIGSTVQGYSAVLAATTAPFLVADKAVVDSAIVDGDFSTNGLMLRTGVGTYSTVANNSTNWDAAYGWGDHASAGYLTNAVTSVALSVPTGLQVSGSPITGTGTFVVTFQSGYSIPTTAKQGQWDAAYGWGNHSGLYLALAGSGNKSVSGVPYIPETTLTDGATITWNFATANVEAVVTLGGNRTLAMSNIPPAGTWATLRVVQGSSTARTLAFGSGIDAGDVGTPTYSSGSGKEDLLSFRSNGTVMQFVGKVGGYA